MSDMQNLEQKKLKSLCQIHAQQSNVDDTERGFRQVHHNVVKLIATLANPKFALDNITVTDILILLFLFRLCPFCVLCRSSQCRSSQLDILVLALGNGLPVSIDFISENPLQIARMLLTIVLYGTEKIRCFVVGIKGKTLNFSIAFHMQFDSTIRCWHRFFCGQ